MFLIKDWDTISNPSGVSSLPSGLHLEGPSEALFDVSTALYALGHYEDATKVLEKLVEQYLYEPRYLASLGACRCDMGYPKEAL